MNRRFTVVVVLVVCISSLRMLTPANCDQTKLQVLIGRKSSMYSKHVEAMRRLSNLQAHAEIQIVNGELYCSESTEAEITKCIEMFRWQSPAEQASRRKVFFEVTAELEEEKTKKDN